MSKKINSYEQLAALWGVEPSESAVSNAVYKTTKCGAWAKYVTADEGKAVRERWHLLLSPFIGGVFVSGVRRSGRWDGKRGWQSPQEVELPPELIEFCELHRHASNNPAIDGMWQVGEFTLISLAETVAVNGSGIVHAAYGRHILTTDIQRVVKTGRQQQGVAFGSIVEGSDAEVGPYSVFFPCFAWEIWGVLAKIEREVREIWGGRQEN